MKSFLKSSVLAFAMATSLVACETIPEKGNKLSMSSIASKHHINSPIMQEGIKQLKEGNLEAAAQMFRAQLKIVPQHAMAHFFNALTYEKMAKNGDEKYLDMAHVGYSLAAKFDPSVSLIHYYKGLSELNRRDYKQAQASFSSAFMLDQKSIKALYGLAVSSYYLYDLTTAIGSIEKVIEKMPTNPLYLRTAAIIMAAGNKKDKSQQYLAKLNSLEGDYREHVQYVQDRIETWGNIHQVVEKKKAGNGLNTASDTPKSKDSSLTSSVTSSSKSKSPTTSKVATAGGKSSGQYKSTNIKNPYNSKGFIQASNLVPPGVTNETLAYASQAKPIHLSSQMILIDLVIMIAEESATESYGVNLLDGLNLSLAGPASATGLFSWGQSISKAKSANRTITGGNAFSISNAAGYTLNIANVNGNKNEVIARPTLTTLSGKQATFSSGNDIVVATSGNGDNSIAGPYNLGLNLIVTPTLLKGGRISLDIQANRKAVDSGSAPSGSNFSQSLYTGHTQITSTVEMNIGDTLILGGLSERTDSSSNDAVPLLGDIPGLQYFFRRETSTQYRKSVIFLVTPRQPDYMYIKEIGGPQADPNSPVLQALFEFKNRYTDWFKPQPNIAEAFKHFQKIGVYREFRNGDALTEEQENLEKILQQVGQKSMPSKFSADQKGKKPKEEGKK